VALFSALSPYRHAGFSIFLFQIVDPIEMTLGDGGLLTYRDMEDGRRVIADTEQIRSAYTEAMQAHIRVLRALAVRQRITYGISRTDTMFYHLFDLLNT